MYKSSRFLISGIFQLWRRLSNRLSTSFQISCFSFNKYIPVSGSISAPKTSKSMLNVPEFGVGKQVGTIPNGFCVLSLNLNDGVDGQRPILRSFYWQYDIASLRPMTDSRPQLSRQALLKRKHLVARLLFCFWCLQCMKVQRKCVSHVACVFAQCSKYVDV